MTSSRGQTVSVLPRPGINSVAVYCDTGTSLGSSSSRKISLNADKTAFRKERTFAQHSCKNFSTNASTAFQNRECGLVKKCSDSLITNSVSSSSLLNSVNRELSPVRWCDREVDGVYLGRSGWVQVQQKSLDDCQEVFYNENIGFSTLPTRKNYSDLRPDCRFEERKECNRPLNLPLATNRRVFRETYERSSEFTKEFESVSPPSVTPIISPPPAFKDEGLDGEFLMQSVREPYFRKRSFLQKSKISADSEIFSNSGRRSALNTPPSTIQNDSVLSSTSKHQSLPNKALHAKSFEDDRSHKMRCSRRFDSALLFRSVDNEIRTTDDRKLSVSDSFPRSFGRPEKKSVKEREEDTGNEKTANKQHFLGLQSSSWEALNDDRFSSKGFSRLSYHNNKRRDFTKDHWNSYRTRSSSLDSNSSSSNGSNNCKSASSSSSCSRSSIDCKNFDKMVSRDDDLTFESQQFQFENSLRKNSRHFNVKRSRSLQLSEKKSPNESVSMLLNNSMSENSWNPVRLLENSTFQTKNQKKKEFPGTILNHVFVTVDNESIPVIASSNQSLKSLNKITKSATEQKKLIMEAEKEARIISEFMNGTRSRAAARNLLMHRYFHQPEDENSAVLMEKKTPQKTEYNSCFLTANQCPSNKSKNLDERSIRKKNQSKPSTPDLGHSEPLNPAFSNSNQSGSFTFSRNYVNQKKVEKVESKQREKSHSAYSDNREKRKKQNASFPLYKSCFDSKAQKEKLSLFSSQKHKKLNNYEGHNCSTEKLIRVPPKTVLEIEKQNFQNNSFEENSLISSSSSSSPSSSSDVGGNDLDEKLKKTKTITGSSAPVFEDYVQSTNSKTLQERFRFRPGSAPESKVAISKTIDKRSLSLPRSFLSERCRLNNFYSRNLLSLKQGHSETPVESPEEYYLNSQGIKTAPATPVRDLRYGNSSGSLYQIPSYRSSSASLFGESPLFKSRRIIQENVPKYLEQSAENSNEMNTFCSDRKLLKSSGEFQRSDSSSETILQILKKKFSMKYLKRREYVRDCSECANSGIKTESAEAVLRTANSSTNSLQALENDCGDFSQHTHGFVGRKRTFKNGKYDSHDSGIQMINRRGIVDSSESQDTDIQEDADSPLVVRKREIRSKDNFCKPKLDCSLDGNHILTDNLKTDLRRRTKESTGKTVRRSHSDLGDNRLLNWNVNERFSFYSSPNRGCNVRTTWGSPSSSEVSITLNRFERLSKPGLRRSLSQPVGLNDLSSSENWKPSTLKGFVLREKKKNSRRKNSDSEFLSDSESSVSSSCGRKKLLDSLPRLETAVFAEAVWDHVVIESDELPFRAGDVIEVLDMRDPDWWWGMAKENIGYFPSAFVRLPVSQEDTVENCLAAMSKGKTTSKQLRRGKSISFLSNDQVRSRIIKELLKTERDFVKILRDIRDGYMTQCKQRTDMFTSAQIATIFSNLEDLLAFQNKFLNDLEANIDNEFPFKSCVGEVFLNHGSSFRIYSEYCNSHPMSIATLQDLYQKYSYCKFFEMCRLKRNLIEISLDGYLLTPVQRICKYPLQLGELLKYTKPDHPDYKNVQQALETMRSVATLINERKRKMESLEKLAAWQQKVEGWEGEDLIEISSQLIHQGDVIKITSGMWTTNITLFLFDHQIIYCKKDLLKKNVYIYKGRISLDESEVIDLPDGKCQQLGVSIRYGLRINNHLENKWLVFCCRSNQDKIKWLEVLAEEKKLVAEDKEKNLNLDQTAKQLAKMSARTNKFPSCKPKSKNKFAFNRHALICAENHSDVPKSKSNKKTGMWFPFGGLMRNTKSGLTPRIPLHKLT